MSLSDLRKVPTDWLEYDDSKAAETIAPEENKQSSGELNWANEWEIIGISSGEASPPLPHGRSQNSIGMSRTGSRQKYPTAYPMMSTDEQRSSQEGGIVIGLCGVRHRIFVGVGFPEIGTGRVVSTRLLLVIRLLFLFIHGISAGFSYALRDKISVKFLLSELFIWLHLTFLFLMPLLLLSSILTLRWDFLRDSRGNEEEPSKQGQGAWLTVEILYQMVMVLAQTELVRLLVMNSVPSLRPITDSEGAELVYSLKNPFAVQRYLTVASTAIDAMLSTVPLRWENCIPSLLLFIPWTAVSLFTRPTTSATVVKIGYQFGFSVLVVMLTFLNVQIHKRLSSWSQRRRQENNDRQKTTIDIV